MKVTGLIKVFMAVLIAMSVTQASAADEQAWQVTGKAWKAMGAKNYDEVVKQADAAQKRWGAKAKADNATLSDYPKGDAAKKHANLNEMATITMLKGNALAAKGDKDGAIAAYKKLISDYKYGQAWDKKGWWWAPSKAAQKSIAKLK